MTTTIRRPNNPKAVCKKHTEYLYIDDNGMTVCSDHAHHAGFSLVDEIETVDHQRGSYLHTTNFSWLVATREELAYGCEYCGSANR